MKKAEYSEALQIVDRSLISGGVVMRKWLHFIQTQASLSRRCHALAHFCDGVLRRCAQLTARNTGQRAPELACASEHHDSDMAPEHAAVCASLLQKRGLENIEDSHCSDSNPKRRKAGDDMQLFSALKLERNSKCAIYSSADSVVVRERKFLPVPTFVERYLTPGEMFFS